MGNKVSIIIPAYNVENEIEDSLRSILNQSYVDLEIIIVNDGSSDGTLNVIKRVTASDDRVKVIDQPNSGVSVARNVGLRISTGEYLYFFDPDDILEKDAIQQLVSCAEKNQVDVVIFNANILKEGRVRPYFRHNRLTENMIYDRNTFLKNTKWNLVPVWIYFFKKSFLLENKLSFKKNVIHEDSLFYVDVISALSSLVYINKSFFLYKKRPKSITGNLYENKYHAKSLRIIKGDLKEKKSLLTTKDIFYEFLTYRINLTTCDVVYFLNNNSTFKSFKYLGRNNLMSKFSFFYFLKKAIKKII